MDRFNTGRYSWLYLSKTNAYISTQYALVFIPGLIVGQLFDMGIYKIPIFLASVMLVVCTILVAQCTEYWQFLLCQGIAVGVSIAVALISVTY